MVAVGAVVLRSCFRQSEALLTPLLAQGRGRLSLPRLELGSRSSDSSPLHRPVGHQPDCLDEVSTGCCSQTAPTGSLFMEIGTFQEQVFVTVARLPMAAHGRFVSVGDSPRMTPGAGHDDPPFVQDGAAPEVEHDFRKMVLPVRMTSE